MPHGLYDMYRLAERDSVNFVFSSTLNQQSTLSTQLSDIFQLCRLYMSAWMSGPVAQDRISISVCWYVIRIIFFSLSSTIRQEEYVQALLPLLALRELYLGLILPESAYVYAFASVFCHRLPSLEVVGIQQVDASAFYHPARIEWWATYVTRGRNGLRYHDICEPLLS